MAQDAKGASLLPEIDKPAAPLRRRVVDALRLSIVNGRLAPGTRLVERELIEMMGVSRTVLRESLRQLESEGLIEVIPSRGAVVRRLSSAEARDLYAIRSVLEGLAARLFVENASPEARRALAAALKETEKAYKSGNPERIVETKNAFYETLFGGAGSETLSAMIDALQARVWRWRVLGLGHPERSRERSQESLNSLKALVKVIQTGDATRAEQIARTEVMNAAAEALRLVAEDEAVEA